MNVYFAGGEDVDFIMPGTSPGVSNSGGRFRSTYSRGYLSIENGSVTDPPTIRAQTPQFGPVTTLWAHAQIFFNGTGSSSGAQMWRWLDPSGICRLALRGTGTASQLKLSKRNAAGTFTDLASFLVSVGE